MREAVINNNIAEIAALLDDGVDVNAKLADNNTALMFAAIVGHVEVAKYLVSSGADLAARDNYDRTALMWSAGNGHVKVVKYLVTAGADLAARDDEGITALMCAAHNGHVEVAKYLVGAGAGLAARDDDGAEVLMFAVHEGHVDVANYLVGAGADLAARNNYGQTALMFAAHEGHVDVVRYLVGAGSDLSAMNNKGQTALMFAAINGHVEVAKYLVSAGADLDVRNNNGATALICAATSDNLNIVKLFMYSSRVLSSANNELPDYMTATLRLEQLRVIPNRRGHSAIFLDKIRNMLLLLNTVTAGGLYGLLTRVRLKLSSWRERILGEDEAIFSSRVNLLSARVCGVAYPEDFTEWYSGMPISKFKAVSSLMRAAKLAKLAHNFNAYVFMHIFMLRRSASTMLAKIPFHSQARTNLLSFIVGLDSVVIMQELTEARKSSGVTSVAASSASAVTVGPECEKADNRRFRAGS